VSVVETQKAILPNLELEPIKIYTGNALAHLEVLATDAGFGNLEKKSCLILEYIARFKGIGSRDRFRKVWEKIERFWSISRRCNFFFERLLRFY
jgi:hypothetical protein